MKVSKEIYRPWGRQLGECILLLNYLINVALDKNEIIRLSTWFNKGWNYNKKTGKVKKATKLKKVLPLFQHSEMIKIKRWKATVHKLMDPKLLWKYPHTPTKIIWKPNNSRKVCYQFDAITKGSARFPSKKAEKKVLTHLVNLGYKVVKFERGRKGTDPGLSLTQVVAEAATSEFFLGVDSGMFHLVSSVGTPVLFCENSRPIRHSYNHSNKHFVLTKNHMDLISAINNYNQNGLEYYMNNARNIHLLRLDKK